MITCAPRRARTQAHAYLRRVTDLPPSIRKRCCYCAVPHPIDGLGPIQPNDVVSDGMCAEAYEREMATLDRRSALWSTGEVVKPVVRTPRRDR